MGARAWPLPEAPASSPSPDAFLSRSTCAVQPGTFAVLTSTDATRRRFGSGAGEAAEQWAWPIPRSLPGLSSSR